MKFVPSLILAFSFAAALPAMAQTPGVTPVKPKVVPLVKPPQVVLPVPTTPPADPPRQQVQHGGGNSLPHFDGVVESPGTKYTMFNPDGEPVRATNTERLRAATPPSPGSGLRARDHNDDKDTESDDGK